MEYKRRQDELSFMLRFAETAFLSEQVCSDQLRALWTAYCIHYDLDVDTGEYDHDLRELWSVVSGEECDTPNWSDLDSFELFMYAWLG